MLLPLLGQFFSPFLIMSFIAQKFFIFEEVQGIFFFCCSYVLHFFKSIVLLDILFLVDSLFLSPL